jgi:hypothetical protein
MSSKGADGDWLHCVTAVLAAIVVLLPTPIGVTAATKMQEVLFHLSCTLTC